MFLEDTIHVQEQDYALNGTFFKIYFTVKSLKVFKNCYF